MAVAMVSTLAACDSVFRFDEPPASDAGATEAEAAVEEAASAGAPCTSDGTCAGLRCDVPTGTCVACLGAGDCAGALRRCDSALHVCVECLIAANCPENHGCDAVTKRCLALCHDSDDPCPDAGFVCDGARSLCIECKSSANCAGSASGPLCDVAIGRCVECTGNAQCPTAKPVCDRRSGRCETCVSSAVCGVGGACDPVTLTCRPAP